MISTSDLLSLSLCDPVLSHLLEEISDKLQRGETIDLEAYCRQHPEHAETLLRVVPSIEVLAQWHSDDSSDPAAQLLGGQPLGDFRLIREIGRGGMGVVYEAEQLSLARRVALKVLPLAAIMDERQRTRFQNEARAAATLNHPNIVPVYSVGIERGVQYFAMQYIEGESLASLIESLRSRHTSDGDMNRHHRAADQPFSEDTVPTPHAALSTAHSARRSEYFRSIAQIGIQVSEALAHAHERGIIHRDIKPANILIDAFGSAMIADFGLAHLEGVSDLTLTGDVVGTLRYAPPEQVLGKQHLVDERVDIYSLGVTLYELLSLHHAFEAKDRQELTRQIADGRCLGLRIHDPSIPKDLETIVRKAMDGDADSRFRSAAEMAAELRRFLGHRPLETRPPSLAQCAAKWVRRHPWPVITALSFTVVILVGVVCGAWLVNQERAKVAAEQRQTALERDRAMDNLRIALDAVDNMYSGFAEAWVAHDNYLSELQLRYLNDASDVYESIAVRISDHPEFQQAAARCLMHAGLAHHRREKFSQAEHNFKEAIALFEISDQTEDQRNLALTWERLGSLYIRLDRLADADRAFAKAIEVREALDLSDSTPASDVTPLGILSIQYSQLRVARLMHRDTDVSELAAMITDSLAKHFRAGAETSPYHTLNLRTRAVWTESLLRSGQFEQADELCRRGLKESGSVRYQDDDRYLLAAVAELKSQWGHVLMERGDYQQAEKVLRDALDTQQKSYNYEGTPKQFAFDTEVSRLLYNPEAFCAYARIQCLLARALSEAGRVKEAFALADEAYRTCKEATTVFLDTTHYAVDAIGAATTLALLAQRHVDLISDKDLEHIQETLGRLHRDRHRLASRPSVLTAAAELNWQYSQYLQQAQRVNESQRCIEQAVDLLGQALRSLPASTALRQRLAEYSVE
jgi:serine/threonine protein kinase/tetratricopeptide (TPR) repeat protein